MMWDYLTPAERSQITALGESDPFARDVLGQLGRILAGPVFMRVQQRAQDFLSFIVHKTLLGRAEAIKESTIAMAVFEEPADFNTAESSKVRVAGIDLRRRLEKHRESADDDPVEILLPPHTFVPEFIDPRVTIEIAPLQKWGASDAEAHVCAAFVEELRYRLSTGGFRASLGTTLRLGSNRRIIVVRGGATVVQERFQANLSAAEYTSGELLFSKTFDEPSDRVFVAARQLAESILERHLDLGMAHAAAVRAAKRSRP